MSGNFKAKCVYTNGLTCYTKDKIYEIVNGCLIDDRGEIIYKDLISIEDLQRRSLSGWELVDDYEKENNMRNFKIRCVDRKATKYIKDKIYNVIDGKLVDDCGKVFLYDLKSFENLQNRSFASWELVGDYKEENNMGSFKVRCVDVCGYNYYTKDKVYNVVNGFLTNDFSYETRFNSFDELQNNSCAKWELVDENTKNLSLTINSKKATISDGEDTLEIDNDCYKNERDMINDLLDKYYDEKNKIKVGDTVKVVDKGYQYKTYSDFIFENAEELQKQMSATEFAKLILNFKNGVSVSEGAGTYKVNLINSMFSSPNNDIKVAIISNEYDTFIIDTRGLEKVKER